MPTVRIQTGATEPIEVLVIAVTLLILIGWDVVVANNP